MTESAPSTRNPRSDLHRLARAVGELFSVTAVLSFLAGVWVNQLVFEQWGLSFLQLATVADVVMSGLTLLSYGLPLTALAALAYAVARQRRVLWLKWLMAAPAALIGMAGLIAMVRIEGASVLVLLGSMVLAGLLLPSALHARAHPSRRGFARQLATASLIVVAIASLVHSTVTNYAEAGYGGSLHLVSPALPNCVGHVLWSGERGTVLSCEELTESGRPKRVLVVQQPEGWVFRHVPRSE